MLRNDFNGGWRYRRTGGEEWKDISLPHDAMIAEKRSADSAGGENTGWFEGYDYEYSKTFLAPKEWAEGAVILEFEGVYRNAEVYVNGREAAKRPYGYTDFYVDIGGLLSFGGENELTVIARNADQPNSRWYSGAGIYRPVWLYTGGRAHIVPDGVRVRTLSVQPAVVEVTVITEGEGEAEVRISRSGKVVATSSQHCAGSCVFTFQVPDAELWSPSSPALYGCKVTFEGDESQCSFGIRKVTCSAKEGLRINGERVILRGACIHSDNGILGASCYGAAEERKIRLMLAAGYNAVRSAHNPCSKALLDACDRLGMLVMDEYADMWYIHKTRFDYAGYLEEWYESDLRDMVAKDYNHPCVIMYSLGNEVAEAGQKRGVELFKKMRDVCKSLDPERLVTVGVNIFFTFLYSIGFGVYSDKKAQNSPHKKVGSEFFNNLAGKLGAGFMKRMATLPMCDWVTRDCFAEMDVAGYNYGILRYKYDLKHYPDRVIVGSETFCSDAYSFMRMAEDNPALIGDFVWSGIDYLGEVGVGSWEYPDYAPSFSHGVGWISAGSGRLDLTGEPLGEMYYTRVAFGLDEGPYIAVVPVGHAGQSHSPSAWKFSNALPSWSWGRQNGAKTRVEVYSRAPVAELYINGVSVGKKRRGDNCVFRFNVRYEDGEITAVARDEGGRELSRHTLVSAGEETMLSVSPEQPAVERGGLCFVRLRFTDEKGVWKPAERGIIRVRVQGGSLLALGNGCPYNEYGYNGDATDTYYGAALAVVRAEGDQVTVEAECGGLRGQCTVEVSAPQAG